MKEAAGAITIILAFIGYVPYIKDILGGRTKPHAFSWLIWTILSFVIFLAQLSRGAGYGAWHNLFTAFICIGIVYLGFTRGEKQFTLSDKLALGFGLLAIPLWVLTKDPWWSVILITVIDVVAFWPTIRKSWNKPRSETLSSFVIAGTKYGVSLVAIQAYNKTTLLYPFTLVFVNSFFVTMLLVRRSKLAS